METNTFDDNPSLSFVQRWIKAFSRILNKIGVKGETNNDEFVNSVLSDEIESASSTDVAKTIEEKRNLLLEMCEDVDSYYKAKLESSKSRDLESWFKRKVSDFTHETIPDADKTDVEEIETMVSDSLDQEIALKTKLLEDGFNADGDVNSKKDEQ